MYVHYIADWPGHRRLEEQAVAQRNEGCVEFVKRVARESIVVLGKVTEGTPFRGGGKLFLAMYVAFNDEGEGQMLPVANWILGRLEYKLPERSQSPRDYDPLRVRLVGMQNDYAGEMLDDDGQIIKDLSHIPAGQNLSPVTFIVEKGEGGVWDAIRPDNENFLQLVVRIEEAIRFTFRDCRDEKERQILDKAVTRLQVLRRGNNRDRYSRAAPLGMVF